jgi:hypothetical protein
MADLGEQIARWQTGDQAALDEMLPVVYDELPRLARNCFSCERPSYSLQLTEPVNEVNMRLVGQREVDWQALQRVLLHYAENRDATKREVCANRGSLDAELASVEKDAAVDIIATVKREWTAARLWLRRELA